MAKKPSRPYFIVLERSKEWNFDIPTSLYQLKHKIKDFCVLWCFHYPALHSPGLAAQAAGWEYRVSPTHQRPLQSKLWHIGSCVIACCMGLVNTISSIPNLWKICLNCKARQASKVSWGISLIYYPAPHSVSSSCQVEIRRLDGYMAIFPHVMSHIWL